MGSHTFSMATLPDDQLKKIGRFHGVYFDPHTTIGIKTEGHMVSKLQKGGQAARSGVKRYHEIVKVNGQDVTPYDQIRDVDIYNKAQAKLKKAGKDEVPEDASGKYQGFAVFEEILKAKEEAAKNNKCYSITFRFVRRPISAVSSTGKSKAAVQKGERSDGMMAGNADPDADY